MSDSTSEAVLKALLAQLNAAATDGVRVGRNEALPDRLPPAGAVILRDGRPGEPAVTMSPRLYHYEHVAEIDVLVIDDDDAARDAAFDTLIQWLGNTIAMDQTLGGVCDYVEATAPAPQEIAPEGGEPIKAGTVDIVLHYASSDPLL